MPNYHRIFIPGGTFFFTVNTYHHQPIFTNPDVFSLFRKSVTAVMEKHPFCEEAYCILPNHIHTLWTLPEHDSDYSLRWRAIKGNFSRWYQELYGAVIVQNKSHRNRKEAAIWQRRYWEHLIRDDRDYNNHMDYIHFNPVKHGLVRLPQEWIWSSLVIHVKNGYYPPDWGDGMEHGIPDKEYGE